MIKGATEKWLLELLTKQQQKKHQLLDEIGKSVNKQLQKIWKSASILALSSRRIHAKLDNYHKYNSLMKDYSSKRKDKTKFHK